MGRSVHLRRWQKAALDLLAGCPGPDFLAVATPGAGKTTFALAAAVQHLSDHPSRRVVVVAPTSHLKLQWSRAAARLGLQLDPAWPSGRPLPADMHGIVVTYQQVAANPEAIRAHAPRCLVVLDELHHTGDERAWGAAVRRAFELAPRRLALSGTPFRSDTHAIPFVRYEADEAVPDFEYGYAAALADRRVVRPVYFPAVDGHMEWTAPDGSHQAASFDDALDPQRSAQRLRTALSLDGEWLPAVLAQAHDRLREIRVDHPSAAGLVIAADQDHARGIARLLHERHRVAAVVATSDDPAASQRIARFADAVTPWIVAVRMVSEGVDIPRLRLGVFATTTTTELFFRQAVGRFVRHTGGTRQHERAWLFIPDDPKLRRWAATVAEQRRHSLRRREEDADPVADLPGSEETDPAAFDEVPGDEEQLSLFQVLSAQVVSPDGAFSRVEGPSAFDDDPDLEHDDTRADTGVAVDLPAPPPPGAGRFTVGLPPELARLPLAEAKQHLRATNADLARDLARLAGLPHREVNGRLNRMAGITRIAEATVDQLRRRADHAERWLTSLEGGSSR